jgi:hypothetical protein
MFVHLGKTELDVTAVDGFTVTFADHDVDDFASADDYAADAYGVNELGGRVNVSIEQFTDHVVFTPDVDCAKLRWTVNAGSAGTGASFNPTQYDRVRAEGNLPDDFPDEKITPHLQAAIMRLRKLLGDTLFEEFAAESDPGDDMSQMDEDERQTFCLLKGEALLACHYGAPVWNLNTMGTGFRQRGGIGDGTYENLGEEDIERVAARFLERAMEWIQPYIPEPDTSTDEEADDVITAGGMNLGAP